MKTARPRPSAEPGRKAAALVSTASAFLKSCVSTPLNAALTIAVLWLLAATVPPLVEWAVIDAVWWGQSSRACAGTDAACWVFVGLRFDQILYGPYPAPERWRIDVALGAAVAGIVALLIPGMPGKKYIGLAMLGPYPVLAAVLLVGGVFGLPSVPTAQWGGLALNLVVAAWAIVTAIPAGLLLALGRRSKLPVVANACAAFIEFWRGLPLIGILFLAVVMFPLFVPPGVEVDKLLRALIAFSVFNAANFAEVFRGGLQAIPRGQYEAAQSLGLGYGRMMTLVILPQVVRTVLPGILNTCVAILKETTIVLVIGLFEFLAVLQAGMADPEWLIGDQVRETGYLFAALVFWALCFGMSRYSAWLERSWSAGQRRA
ncbi:MAG TPA: amino acid ABC transporter permease [Alphaproteobacteria bacterium]